ncbi:signal sequence receptor alpha subunit [Fusarium heterosporum]|uniref:Signal sequence receptor alpha subunit n=1 Tax=Fusarium heterosporum TaxID=42747 RepID=A0A8H5TQQ3_FUSHE|nr:signal sequence receptor alpha subunit [Fusarium heterosporum]
MFHQPESTFDWPDGRWALYTTDAGIAQRLVPGNEKESDNTYHTVDAWVYSPRSNVHISNSGIWFTKDYRECNYIITSANAIQFPVIGCGTAAIPVQRAPENIQMGDEDGGDEEDELDIEPQSYLVLHNVAYCPSIPYSICGKPDGFNYIVSMDETAGPDRRIGTITDAYAAPVAYLTEERHPECDHVQVQIHTSQPPLGPFTTLRWTMRFPPVFHWDVKLPAPPSKRLPLLTSLPLPTPHVFPGWLYSEYSNVHVCRDRAWFGDTYVPLISEVACDNGVLDVASIGIVKLQVHELWVLTMVLHCPKAHCNTFKFPLSKESSNRRLVLRSGRESGNCVVADLSDYGRVVADLTSRKPGGFRFANVQNHPEGTHKGPYTFWKAEIDVPSYRWLEHDVKRAELIFPQFCT